MSDSDWLTNKPSSVSEGMLKMLHGRHVASLRRLTHKVPTCLISLRYLTKILPGIFSIVRKSGTTGQREPSIVKGKCFDAVAN
jgi:hypothetical protein